MAKGDLPYYRKVLADYPTQYDAHFDRLADAYEHRQNVNELLRALREANAHIMSLGELVGELRRKLAKR